ncbi:hypothetical protein NE236_23550 [Actinoallomurus purpureus]|uniref:hypothetical protein n=1 Tax=Actinoallomurus purpureus TaxID=478114 RepID=UPI002091F545|nr:hypothetical protein [Actinoallomurus purpureus]MCO6007959.1 hypothetical protein [Actinoallomurus purpureus]
MNGTEGDTTGDERVDAALARLTELEQAPLTEHPAVFADVHRRLQEALTGLDEGAS